MRSVIAGGSVTEQPVLPAPQLMPAPWFLRPVGGVGLLGIAVFVRDDEDLAATPARLIDRQALLVAVSMCLMSSAWLTTAARM